MRLYLLTQEIRSVEGKNLEWLRSDILYQQGSDIDDLSPLDDKKTEQVRVQTSH